MISKKILNCSIALIMGGSFFVIHDGIINHLTEIEFKFYHHIFYTSPWLVLIIIYLYFTGNIKTYLRSTNYSILVFRGFLFLPLPYMLFLSLQNISLPEWTTLNMISPILGSIFGIFFLKEKINIFTTGAIFFGFVGVIFIIQPGFQDFSFYYFFPIYGAFTLALQSFLANKYSGITTTLGFFVYGLIPVTLVSFFLFLFDPLINYQLMFISSITGLIALFGVYLVTYAFQNSQNHFSSIFALFYLQILWSLLIGIIFFNEFLNFIAIIGSLLIVLSGLLSLKAQNNQLKDI